MLLDVVPNGSQPDLTPLGGFAIVALIVLAALLLLTARSDTP